MNFETGKRLARAQSLTAGISIATSGVLFMNALRPIVGTIMRATAAVWRLGTAEQPRGDEVDAARLAHRRAHHEQHADGDHPLVRHAGQGLARASECRSAAAASRAPIRITSGVTWLKISSAKISPTTPSVNCGWRDGAGVPGQVGAKTSGTTCDGTTAREVDVTATLREQSVTPSASESHRDVRCVGAEPFRADFRTAAVATLRVHVSNLCGRCAPLLPLARTTARRAWRIATDDRSAHAICRCCRCWSVASTAAAVPKTGRRWRGPRGDGTSAEQNVPTRWSGEENVAWKVAGAGHGPCLAHRLGRPRCFVATCLEDEQERILLCFDRASGRLLWQQVGAHARRWKKSTSSTASPPARRPPTASWCTSRFSIATRWSWRPTTFRGKQKWLVRPGGFSSKHGYCSCPVLFEDKVIVNGDHDGDAYLVALDRATGKTVVEDRPREQDPQLLDADHSPDRRPHADDPLGQQVRGQLRPARRLAALDHRRPDRAVRGLDGLQRQAAVPDRRLSRVSHAGHPARRHGQRHRHAHRLAHDARRPATSPRRSPRAIISWSSPTAAWPVASRPTPASGCGWSGWARTTAARWSRPAGWSTSPPTKARPRSSGPARSSTSWPKTSWASTATPRPPSASGQIFFRGEKHLYCIGDKRVAKRAK